MLKCLTVIMYLSISPYGIVKFLLYIFLGYNIRHMNLEFLYLFGGLNVLVTLFLAMFFLLDSNVLILIAVSLLLQQLSLGW
jgi:hypothetical protein